MAERCLANLIMHRSRPNHPRQLRSPMPPTARFDILVNEARIIPLALFVLAYGLRPGSATGKHVERYLFLSFEIAYHA